MVSSDHARIAPPDMHVVDTKDTPVSQDRSAAEKSAPLIVRPRRTMAIALSAPLTRTSQTQGNQHAFLALQIMNSSVQLQQDLISAPLVQRGTPALQVMPVFSVILVSMSRQRAASSVLRGHTIR